MKTSELHKLRNYTNYMAFLIKLMSVSCNQGSSVPNVLHTLSILKTLKTKNTLLLLISGTWNSELIKLIDNIQQVFCLQVFPPSAMIIPAYCAWIRLVGFFACLFVLHKILSGHKFAFCLTYLWMKTLALVECFWILQPISSQSRGFLFEFKGRAYLRCLGLKYLI